MVGLLVQQKMSYYPSCSPVCNITKTHTKPLLELETCISTKYVNSVATTITLPSLCLPVDIAILSENGHKDGGFEIA